MIDIEQLWGARIHVAQILTKNPHHSGTGFGFMVEGIAYDIDDRVPCDGVGILCSYRPRGIEDSVALVAFYNEETRESALAFAAVEDIKPADAPYRFPVNTDYVTVWG